LESAVAHILGRSDCAPDQLGDGSTVIVVDHPAGEECTHIDRREQQLQHRIGIDSIN
jgi:hypothetical protein